MCVVWNGYLCSCAVHSCSSHLFCLLTFSVSVLFLHTQIVSVMFPQLHRYGVFVLHHFLLHSQLYLGDSSFFVCETFVQDLAIEVVTFCLHGWWVLGVLLLLEITLPGHECQDLLSPCDGMHMCTDWTLVYTLIRKSSREWSQSTC